MDHRLSSISNASILDEADGNNLQLTIYVVALVKEIPSIIKLFIAFTQKHDLNEWYEKLRSCCDIENLRRNKKISETEEALFQLPHVRVDSVVDLD